MAREKPQKLNADIVDGWMKAADKRPDKSPATLRALRKMMALRNPWRWRRLKSDYAWLQKELQKKGFNPEDARWLL